MEKHSCDCIISYWHLIDRKFAVAMATTLQIYTPVIICIHEPVHSCVNVINLPFFKKTVHRHASQKQHSSKKYIFQRQYHNKIHIFLPPQFYLANHLICVVYICRQDSYTICIPPLCFS